ncbi:MAG: hypothetical protein JO301_04135 [Chitinophagaceae bacterium]|nr:hypothetical protein [Chitinophagaceae bacterium]
MNRVSIERIKAQVVALGFDTNVEEKLQAHVSFGESSFVLQFLKRSGGDQCRFGVQVEGDTVPYYTAVLRKEVVVPQELRTLEERMQKIDWPELSETMRIAGEVTMPGPMISAAGELLQEVRAVPDHPVLLYKYWAGTAFETKIPGFASIRNDQEISQRFYVVQGQPVITGDEAFKFLQNKWMERRMVSARKERPHSSREGVPNNESKKKRARKK